MNKNTGFTLVEMIITIAVMAIVSTIGVPSFNDVILSSYAVTHTNDFLSSLNLARSEAIKRGQRVVVCKSLNNICQASLPGWEQGWMVFVDSNNTALLDSNEFPLRVHGPLKGGDTLRGNQNVSSYISYSPDGTTKLKSGAFQAGTLTFGLCVHHKKNEIVISSSGRARLKKEPC